MVLALWGIGMIVGNLIGGWLADRALVPAIFYIMIWNALPSHSLLRLESAHWPCCF